MIGYARCCVTGFVTRWVGIRWLGLVVWMLGRVKGADTVGVAVRGFDVGKKVNGRKRHIVVDTMGLLLFVVIISACV